MEQAKKKTATATTLDEKIANVRKQNKREVRVDSHGCFAFCHLVTRNLDPYFYLDRSWLFASGVC